MRGDQRVENPLPTISSWNKVSQARRGELMSFSRVFRFRNISQKRGSKKVGFIGLGEISTIWPKFYQFPKTNLKPKKGAFWTKSCVFIRFGNSPNLPKPNIIRKGAFKYIYQISTIYPASSEILEDFIPKQTFFFRQLWSCPIFRFLLFLMKIMFSWNLRIFSNLIKNV